MTPEQAAENAANNLYQARVHAIDAATAAALVQVADGWTRLHTALATTEQAILTIGPLTPVTVNMTDTVINEEAPATPNNIPDSRDEAREWINGFFGAAEEDRVNTVALLLGAARDAQGCVADGHMAMVRALVEYGWTPPGDEPAPCERAAPEPPPAAVLPLDGGPDRLVELLGERFHVVGWSFQRNDMSGPSDLRLGLVPEA